MSRSTIILVIILIFSCLWFSTAMRSCSPGGGFGYGGGVFPIPLFIGGGGNWDRGGWDRSGSSPPVTSPSRSTGGGLRGGGISGGRGGK